MRLSYTAVSTYQECGQKYKLHYLENLRTEKLGSALFFGKAMDAAIGRLLLNKKKTLTEDEKTILGFSAETLFESNLRLAELPQGGTEDIRKSLLADYYQSDLDIDILEAADLKAMEGDLSFELHSLSEFVDFVLGEFKAKRKLNEKDQTSYNRICWQSLYRKGLILLKDVETYLEENIEEVTSIQERVELQDGNDKFIGYIDCVASFNDMPGIQYVIDFKTSSRPYKDDAIKESKQLPIYCEYKDNYNASYIVIEKKLRKKEPRVRIQLMREKLDTKKVDAVFQEITGAMQKIEEAQFEKNWDACYSYGKPCAFYNYCRTGDTAGIAKKK